MSPQAIARLVGIGLLIFVAVLVAASGTYVVQPGYRGRRGDPGGECRPAFKPDGFGLKLPLMTTIHPVSIRQPNGRGHGPSATRRTCSRSR